MDYNVLIGGSAGQGMETLASALELILKRKGFEIFTIRDYMSRVRGGHNFIQVRFANEKLTSHKEPLDVIIALNEETVTLHKGRLTENGVVICDKSIPLSESQIEKYPLSDAAAEIGNPRVVGNVALGVLLKAFDLDLAQAEEVMKESFHKPDVAEMNIAAVHEGFKMGEVKFPFAPAGKDEHILINGNQAIAMGALAAGCKFYSAYPMTPSTSIMNYLASKMEEAEVVVEQAEDEIAAVMMAIGASFAGTRAMTGTSGGGFSLMVEALGLSGMLEVPLVIAEIQRPGPTTGFPTRTEQGDLKFVVSASQGEFPRMVIALKNPEDAFYQTVRAFNLADKYRIPVILLGDQFLADYTCTIPPFDFNRVKVERHLNHDQVPPHSDYKSYEITESGISPRIIPGKIPGVTLLVDSDEHDEYGHITESAEIKINMTDKRLRKLEVLKEELQEPEFVGSPDCEALILAWGSLYGPVAEAVRRLNEKGKGKYGALVFGDIWPLPQILLQKKAQKAQKIINVEQNATGQLAALIREVTGIQCSGSILKYDGRPMSSGEIMEQLERGV